MDKKYLLLLVGLGALSVYTINLVATAASPSVPANPTGATDSTVTSIGPAPGVLNIRVLNTTVPAASGSIATSINTGAIGTQCPATISCGNPNAPGAPATCPDVCFVVSPWVAWPTSQPYQYKSCPPGYSTVASGNTDTAYVNQSASTIFPSSLSQLSTLQSGGYTCTMTGGAQGGCPSPYAGSPGTRFEAGGYVWEITGWWCKSSAGGASWCSWDVACGATVNQTYYRVLICTRPAGYFPVPANMPPDSTGVRRYQLAPVYTICGRVRTDWVSGGTN